VLAWSVDRFGPRVTFATAFGPEGCVLLDLIGRQARAIDVFTLDTGLLFPESYTLWTRIETRYGLRIRGVRPELSLEDQAQGHGARLWERDPASCCELRKLAPLRRALAGFEAWVTSIRRDQAPDRAGARVVEWDRRFGLVKVNPLASWDSRQVWRHIVQNDVPYNPLHDRGYPSLGCVPCTSPVRPGEGPRAGRWRGFARTECGLHAKEGA
jgi:phosphoadenosine phosphosulfate reductase